MIIGNSGDEGGGEVNLFFLPLLIDRRLRPIQPHNFSTGKTRSISENKEQNYDYYTSQIYKKLEAAYESKANLKNTP